MINKLQAGEDIKEQVIPIILLRKYKSIKYKTTDYIKLLHNFSFFCTLKGRTEETAFTKASLWLGTLLAHGLIWRPESQEACRDLGALQQPRHFREPWHSHSVRSPGGEEHGSQIFAKEIRTI